MYTCIVAYTGQVTFYKVPEDTASLTVHPVHLKHISPGVRAWRYSLELVNYKYNLDRVHPPLRGDILTDIPNEEAGAVF